MSKVKLEEELTSLLQTCPSFGDHCSWLSELRSAVVTVQTDTLARFDFFLLSSIKVKLSMQGDTFMLYGNREKLLKLGFLFRENDEFLPSSQFMKLAPLISDLKRIRLDSDNVKIGKPKVRNLSELMETFIFHGLSKNRPSFFTRYPNWMEHAVNLSLAVSSACEALALPLVGSFTLYKFGFRSIVREGSCVRGVLVSHYLRVFRGLDLPAHGIDIPLIKAIKNSLFKFWIRSANKYQISPTERIVNVWGSGPSFSVIPRRSWNRMEQRIREEYLDSSASKILQLSYSIAQSKSLCTSVSSDFVLASLHNHAKSLSSEEDRELPDVVRSVLHEVGLEFGKRVANYYSPYQTVLPNRSACVERSRAKGGLLAYVNKKFSAKPKSLRCEPLVIGFFGPPGSGKSLALNHLVKFFQREFNLPDDPVDSVYFRNPHCDHWDGYRGQFITVIDDFGQDLVNCPDLREFDQMVSCSTFYPPMADLANKGIIFSSQVVVLTSNLVFGKPLISPDGSPILAEPLSIWRRIHLPFVVMKFKVGLDERTILPSMVFDGTGALIDSNYSSDQLEEGESDGNVHVTSRFYKIIPGSQEKWNHTHGVLMGTVASASAHLPSIGEVPNSLSGLDRNYRDRVERVSSSYRRTTISFPSPKEYAVTDRRNTGMNSIGYSLEETTWDSLERNSISLFYTRQEQHFNIIGCWPQTVIDEEIDFSYCDSPLEWPLGTGDEAYCETPSVWLSRVSTPTSRRVKKTYYFPSTPPLRPPRVSAVGLAEPLKCRVITVPEGVTRCLKPLQMAMCRALSTYPQFALTHNSYWDMNGDFVESNSVEAVSASLARLTRDFLSDPDRLALSGDYAAATDDFIMEVSHVLMRAILESIPHQPTREWALWELSPSLISYPFGSFLQTRGQRMGSLLSFPLLCLANDALCRLSGFDPGSYLINGDDLAAGVSAKQHTDWRYWGSVIGLKPNDKYLLSSGSRKIIMINSQLWDVSSESLLPAGKLSCMVRRDKPLADCLGYLQRYYGTNILRSFIRINHIRLQFTPRSPAVPLAFGGLGSLFVKNFGFDLRTAKFVYLSMLMRRVWRSPQRVFDSGLSIVTIPVLSTQFQDEQANIFSAHSLSSFEEERSVDIMSMRLAYSLIREQNRSDDGLLAPEPYRLSLHARPLIENQDQLSSLHLREYLGQGYEEGPWFSSYPLIRDPIERVYIALCQHNGLQFQTSEQQLSDELTQSEFRRFKKESLPKFSQSFLDWLELRECLHVLPRLTDFSTRYMVVTNEEVNKVRDIVYSVVENIIVSGPSGNYEPPASYWQYKDDMDRNAPGDSSPIYFKHFKWNLNEELFEDEERNLVQDHFRICQLRQLVEDYQRIRLPGIDNGLAALDSCVLVREGELDVHPCHEMNLDSLD